MIDQNVVLIRINEDIAETDFEGKVVLLHIENGAYYNFNVTGSDLWRWLEQENSAYDLAIKISQKYDCSVEECLPDVLSWIDDVLDKKIVKIK